jgi:hypothetical protein
VVRVVLWVLLALYGYAVARLIISRGEGQGVLARSRITPLGAVLRGGLASAAGIAVMDTVGYVRYRRVGGTGSPLRWEFGGPQDWEKVSAPGQVGKRLVEAFTQRPLSARWAPLTNTVVHWAYGIGWGSLYGLVAGSLDEAPSWYGVPFGVVVWISGYLILPLGHLYKPLWEYDPPTLAKDLGTHLAYGLGTASAFHALSRR